MPHFEGQFVAAFLGVALFTLAYERLQQTLPPVYRRQSILMSLASILYVICGALVVIEGSILATKYLWRRYIKNRVPHQHWEPVESTSQCVMYIYSFAGSFIAASNMFGRWFLMRKNSFACQNLCWGQTVEIDDDLDVYEYNLRCDAYIMRLYLIDIIAGISSSATWEKFVRLDLTNYLASMMAIASYAILKCNCNPNPPVDPNPMPELPGQPANNQPTNNQPANEINEPTCDFCGMLHPNNGNCGERNGDAEIPNQNSNELNDQNENLILQNNNEEGHNLRINNDDGNANNVETMQLAHDNVAENERQETLGQGE